MDSESKQNKLDATNTKSSIVDVGSLSTNMFLTINDGASKNSQEFLTIECNDVEIVKQEQNVIYNEAPTLPVEYRVVNRLQPRLNTPVKTLANVFPATMQLPSGCEIYLINEYVESFENDEVSTIISTDSKKPFSSMAALKLEPTVCEEGSNKNNQLLQTKVPWISSSDKTTAGSVVQYQNEVNEENTKRSYLLDAYKKRDDKRRATHNEVERRRRDKINSWIFKLKELLPKDTDSDLSVNGAKATAPASTKIKPNSCDTNFNSVLVSKKLAVNQQRTSNNIQNRTPQVESKSQILIKACEYIKSMQEEVNSLRKCLTENECLRLNNQRLQLELNKLRSERRTSLPNIDSSREELQSYTKGSFNTSITPMGTTKINANRAVFSPYIKREFIIRDYVD